MEARKPVFGKSNSVEDMQHVRLMALLQELEREHGRKGAAAVLGLDHRTLGASLDEGVLSRRVRGALERALQEGIGSAADRQRGAQRRAGEASGGAGGRRRGAGEGDAGGTQGVGGRNAGRARGAGQGAQGVGGKAGAAPDRRVSPGRCHSAQARPAQAEGRAQAGVPRPGDPRARRGRRGGVRRRLEADRRVAGAEGRAPQPGRRSVVAGCPGAAADGGAGAAGGARDDASPGDVPAARLRTGTGRPVGEGPRSTTRGERGQGGSYSGACSPCGCGGSSRLPVRGVAVNFCEHFGGNLRKGACRPSHRGAGPGDNDCAVWLSPRFPTIETWVRGPCCTGMTGG